MNHEPRIAVRDAVKSVIGRRGSAVTGDVIFDELRASGWELYRPEDCDRIVWHVTHPVVEDRTYRLVPVETTT